MRFGAQPLFKPHAIYVWLTFMWWQQDSNLHEWCFCGFLILNQSFLRCLAGCRFGY